MARISITTDSGVLVDVIDQDGIGDLDKPIARAALMEEIRRAVKMAHEEEAEAASGKEAL